MKRNSSCSIGLLALLAGVLLLPLGASALLVGPYTVDANTLHLYHFDESGTPVIDYATGGTNLTSLQNGATLGTAGAAGFGTALNTYDGGPAGTNAAGKDAVISCRGTGAAVNIAYADSTTGAFTYEALVHIDFDPAESEAAAPAGTGRNAPMHIVNCEAGGGNRVFQLRLDPVGINPGATGAGYTTNLTYPVLEFIKIAGPTEWIVTPIPTAGPDAILSNQWYHVAVAYNGSPNTADNFKVYWTLLDGQKTSASLIGSWRLTNSLSPASPNNTTFTIGNGGRSQNGNFVGLIDEVRMSKIARSAQGMMFAPAEVQIDTDPASQLVAAGDTVTLISAASGGGIIGYQWQCFDTNIPAAVNPTANSSTLVITNIATTQAGPYRVIATNSVSSRTSLVATISVGMQVAETFATGLSDNRAPLPVGSIDPHWQLVQSDDPAYPGPALYVDSAPPTTWLANSTNSQWLSPGDGANNIGGNYTFRTTFLLDSADPAFVQLNGKYIADNQLVDVRINGASTGLTNSGALNAFSLFTLTNGFVPGVNTLDFVVTNFPGGGANPTGIRAELRGAALPLASQAPQVLALPVNVTTQAQQSASFSVVVSGSPTLLYQWYHDTTPLSGKTDRNLALSNLIPADQGTYTVYVTNSLGWTNASATLTVVTPPLLAWVGQDLLAPATWDTASLNWLNTGSSSSAAFANYNDVLFDSRGSSAPFVNLAQPLQPNSITVDSTTDYTLYSPLASGWLTGSFPLTKKNSATLILDMTNLSTGPITVAGGTLQVGNYDFAPGLGRGNVSISNNAALVFARADAWQAGNVISGGGAVTNLVGTTILTGNNSYTGPTVVSAGTLAVRNGAALGSAASGTTVAAYGQLLIDTAIDITDEPLTLNGSGPVLDGALRKGGSSTSTYGGPITLAADATIKVDGSSTLRITNAAGLHAANHILTLAADSGGTGIAASPLVLGTGLLTKDGAGTWQLLSAANTGTGGTFINAGTLQLGNGLFDGNLPLGPVTNNGTLTFNGANAQTIPNQITGSGGVTQSGTNTTTLSGANDYAGVTAVNNGTLLVANNLALGNPDTNTTIPGNFGAVSRVAFAGNFTVPETFLLGGRQPSPDISAVAAHLINLSGTNTLTGPITSTTGGNQYNLESAGGLFIIAGNYSQASGTGDRLLNLQGTGDALWTGAINDGAARVNVTMRGTGTWTLAGSNSYTGPTLVSSGTLVINGLIQSNTVTVQTGGTLAGKGQILAPVTVQAAGILAPGAGDIGTLTISNILTLQAGSTNVFDVNAASGAADQVAGLTSVAYGGTLKVNNLGGNLTTASAFQLFSAGAYSGSFASIVPATPGSGLAWNTSTLTTDGILRVGTGVALNPTNLAAVLVSNGSTLQLSWPADHTGWTLQAQTNTLAVGLVTNAAAWFPVPDSSTTNQVFIPINKANGSVFYRLIYTAP